MLQLCSWNYAWRTFNGLKRRASTRSSVKHTRTAMGVSGKRVDEHNVIGNLQG
jgi:hypothetical protein